ncbi:MAG: DUF502 domain-containing protein [Phycisphaerales bacterium]|nr:MAG: DUF502 domain-containing protein [Phycisphaerales bacterium]
MERLREFIKSTLIGGLLVLLPLGISAYVLVWIFNLVAGAISPLTKIVMETSPAQGLVADIVAIGLLIWVCFLVGMLVRTRLGRWGYLALESKLLKRAPGYSMIKETVTHFLGKDKQSPFSSVALARLFGNDTLVSVFVTDTHDDGSYTVFMPTGPNPTSGNIYHLPGENVIPVDVPVEDTMRSIISCGAGSSALIAKYNEAQARPPRKED